MILFYPFVAILVFYTVGVGAAPPPLPAGLGGSTAPVESMQPTLPRGPDGTDDNPTEPPTDEFTDIVSRGFWEARAGFRTHDDRYQSRASLLETRLQLRLERPDENLDLTLAGDFILDDRARESDLDLETGQGHFDLREANILLRPFRFADLKLGRQITTWGTGDLLFINDLFPKDYRSFFLGRDGEYLKAPSDAIRFSLFSGPANLDLVYTPRFDPDRFIDGRRISYFDPAIGSLTNGGAPMGAQIPDRWFTDDEVAVRLYRNLSGYELAAYAYDGRWKSPAGRDPATGQATFPRLSVYGLSLRGALGRGVGHLEFGYYDSREDRHGTDPMVSNRELRLLAGFEREVASETTLGFQYYLERMLNYAAYRRTLPATFPREDQDRHVLTLRLTRLALQQDLKISLFAFWSPSDDDAYLRPKINYKVDDHWSVECGANFFVGDRRHTFFGQFEDNSNLYLAVRYGFGN